MQTWMMRILGALNILYVAISAWYSVIMVHMHWNRWPGNPTSMNWAVFLFLYALSAVMIVYLAYLGIRLIRKDSKVLLQLCFLFVAEMVYFFVFVTVTWVILPMSMSKIAVGFWGMAQDPLAPQVITGYPLVGLVFALFMLLMRRRLPKAHSE